MNGDGGRQLIHWEAFIKLCDVLKLGLLAEQQSDVSQIKWFPFVEVCNLQVVAPAAAWCLQSQALPEDVATYFETVRSLNLRREQAILEALLPAAHALNCAGVEPLLLKGISHLVDGLYPVGTRLVGDVDMLIDADAAEAAVKALVGIGYSFSGLDPPKDHRHLKALHDRASGLVIELHTRIERDSDNPVFPVRWILAESRPLAFRGTTLRLGTPTGMIAHNFANRCINDEKSPSPVDLRHLLDIALIRKKYGDQVDWEELNTLCMRSNRQTELATYLMFAEKLFGQPLPAPVVAAPDSGAFRRLREYVDPAERQPGLDVDVVSFVRPGTAAVHLEGNCWQLELPAELLPGDDDVTRASALQLFLNDELLGPPYAALVVIREVGLGAYTHRLRELLFSMPDNRPPKPQDVFLVRSWAPRARLFSTIDRLRGDHVRLRFAASLTTAIWLLRLRLRRYPSLEEAIAKVLRLLRAIGNRTRT